MNLAERASANDGAQVDGDVPPSAAPFALWSLEGGALDRAIARFGATDGASPTTPLVDLVCDSVGVVDANPAAAALLGSDHQTALLAPMRYLFAASPETVGRIIAARLAGRRQHVEDMTLRRFDGRTLEVLLQVTFPPPGEPTTILILMIDITGRLRGGELMSSVAHEVRQPLAAIATSADASLRWLDRDTPNLERVRLLLGRIGANARRANDLLLRSHQLARDPLGAHDRLNLNTVVVETCELVRHDAEERGIGFELSLAEAPLHVRGDKVQLQQVVFNLLTNAVQAIDPSSVGRRRIDVSTAIADDAVRVSVRDTGPGIPPADLDRIFLRTFTTKPDGMGLGLAICRSIVEAHQGAIQASNLPGGGAGFDVVLPAAAI